MDNKARCRSFCQDNKSLYNSKCFNSNSKWLLLKLISNKYKLRSNNNKRSNSHSSNNKELEEILDFILPKEGCLYQAWPPFLRHLSSSKHLSSNKCNKCMQEILEQ